jgi:hypothetical protein
MATTKPKETLDKSPEAVAARREARRVADDKRLRKSLLTNAEAALKRSRVALDAGDMDEHVKWFGIAVQALGSYETVTADDSPNGTASQE